jgi:hypothetical protein
MNEIMAKPTASNTIGCSDGTWDHSDILVRTKTGLIRRCRKCQKVRKFAS